MHSSAVFPTLPRKLRPRRRRVASCLAYDGSGFHGFQRQPGQRTVEGELITALTGLGLTGGLSFASRTDTGVHASGQVICFNVDSGTELLSFQQDFVARLPADIRVHSLVWAPAKFHPRWTAAGKRYVYTLRWKAPDARSWTLEAPLEAERLETALDALRRAPFLTGFTGAGAPLREMPPLSRLEVEACTDGVRLVFEGAAFARYAIRHMVGCLVAEARGEVPSGTITTTAATTSFYRGLRAPAAGLVLERVFYPPTLDPFSTPSPGDRM